MELWVREEGQERARAALPAPEHAQMASPVGGSGDTTL